MEKEAKEEANDGEVNHVVNLYKDLLVDIDSKPEKTADVEDVKNVTPAEPTKDSGDLIIDIDSALTQLLEDKVEFENVVEANLCAQKLKVKEAKKPICLMARQSKDTKDTLMAHLSYLRILMLISMTLSVLAVIDAYVFHFNAFKIIPFMEQTDDAPTGYLTSTIPLSVSLVVVLLSIVFVLQTAILFTFKHKNFFKLFAMVRMLSIFMLFVVAIGFLTGVAHFAYFNDDIVACKFKFMALNSCLVYLVSGIVLLLLQNLNLSRCRSFVGNLSNIPVIVRYLSRKIIYVRLWSISLAILALVCVQVSPLQVGAPMLACTTDCPLVAVPGYMYYLPTVLLLLYTCYSSSVFFSCLRENWFVIIADQLSGISLIVFSLYAYCSLSTGYGLRVPIIYFIPMQFTAAVLLLMIPLRSCFGKDAYVIRCVRKASVVEFLSEKQLAKLLKKDITTEYLARPIFVFSYGGSDKAYIANKRILPIKKNKQQTAQKPEPNVYRMKALNYIVLAIKMIFLEVVFTLFLNRWNPEVLSNPIACVYILYYGFLTIIDFTKTKPFNRPIMASASDLRVSEMVATWLVLLTTVGSWNDDISVWVLVFIPQILNILEVVACYISVYFRFTNSPAANTKSSPTTATAAPTTAAVTPNAICV